MKTMLWLLTIADIGLLIASILCFALCSPAAIGIVPFLAMLIGLIATVILFMSYTNRYHDRNAEQTLDLFRSWRGIQDCYDCTEVEAGIFEIKFNDYALRLDLVGYPFKKAFVAALVIRLLNYASLPKKGRFIDFFKRRFVGDKLKKDDIYLCFLSAHRKKKTTILKRGKIRFGFLVELILFSKFKLFVISYNDYYLYKKAIVTYSEKWFLHGEG